MTKVAKELLHWSLSPHQQGILPPTHLTTNKAPLYQQTRHHVNSPRHLHQRKDKLVE